MKKTILIYLLVITLILPVFVYGIEDQCIDLNKEVEKLRRENNSLIEKIEKLENPDVNFERYKKRNIYLRANSQVASKIPVLMYHHILPQADMDKYGHNNNNAILALEEFKKQMKYLKDNNFYTASLEELDLFLNGQIFLPKKTVVISFDDGYLSNTHYAYPILKEYGFNAAIFLIGDIAEKDHSEEFNPKKIQFISRKNISKYRDVFEFQSHTYGMHKNVKGKTLLVTSNLEDLNKDFKNMKDIYNSKYIAYPHGSYNSRVIDIAKKHGYKLGFTIKPGYLTQSTDSFKIPRYEVSKQSMSFNRFKNIVNK